jgi:hypothetical protein
MLALRYAAVLALVFWMGGLAVLGAFAAPAMFELLGTTAEGRALAGKVFGETLTRFHTGAYVCGGVLVASLAARRVLGPRPRHFAIRLIVATIMTGAAVWSGLVVTPRIEEARRAAGAYASPSALPEGDARRAEFDRLHNVSRWLHLVPVLGGLALLFFELKD